MRSIVAATLLLASAASAQLPLAGGSQQDQIYGIVQNAQARQHYIATSLADSVRKLQALRSGEFFLSKSGASTYLVANVLGSTVVSLLQPAELDPLWVAWADTFSVTNNETDPWWTAWRDSSLSNPKSRLIDFEGSVAVPYDSALYYAKIAAWRSVMEDSAWQVQYPASSDTFYALTFDGSKDYAYCTDAQAGTEFDFGDSSFTIEMWVKTRDVSHPAANEQLMWSARKYPVTDHRVNLGIQTAKAFIVIDGRVLGGTYEHVIGGTSLAANTWAHVAGVVDRGSANELRLYVNGRLDGAPVDITGFPSLTIDGNYYIGCIYQGGAHFDGEIAQLRIFRGEARTQADIQSDMASMSYTTETWASGFQPGSGTSVTPDIGTVSYTFGLNDSTPTWKKNINLDSTGIGPQTYGPPGIAVTKSRFLGVGTMPLYALHIKPGIGNRWVYTDFGTGSDGSVRYVGNVGSTFSSQLAVTFESRRDNSVWWQLVSRQTPTYDRFEINYEGSNPVFVVDSIGQVGIGTSTPTTKLDVNGASTLRGASRFYAGITSSYGYAVRSTSFSDTTGGATMQGINEVDTGYDRAWFGSNARWDAPSNVWKVNNIGANDATGWLIPNSGGVELIQHASTGAAYREFTHTNFKAGSIFGIGTTGNITGYGRLAIPTDSSYTIGDPSTDGSWRIATRNDSAFVQNRLSGTWVQRMTLIPNGNVLFDSTAVFLDGINEDIHTYDEGGAGPPSNTTLNAAFPTASIGDRHTMRDANNTSALYEVQKTTSTTWRYWASTACP